MTLVLLSNSIFGQKTELIHQSSFKHDNVLERAMYLEEIKDTIGCKYIATLNVTSQNHPGNVIEAVNLIGIKAKELGGNAFFIQSFKEVDSSLSMIVKVHYAFKKVYDANKEKRVKTKIFVFSFLKIQNLYQYFYLNDSLKYISAMHCFTIEPVIDQKYNIKSCNSEGVAISSRWLGVDRLKLHIKGQISYKAKKEKDALFACLYTDKFLTEDQKTPKQNIKIFKCGVYEMEYREGRTLLEIFESKK